MNAEIAEYSPTAAALAELRQKYEKSVFDTATPNGMAKAIAARRELREIRVNLEKLRKELKAPALERSRLIDAEAKTLTAQIESLENPIDAQIKAEEQRKADEKAERERIEREELMALQNRVTTIRNAGVKYAGKTADEIAGVIRRLTDFEIGDDFGPMQPEAHAAKAETLATLREMWDRAKEHEAEAERLKIERAELEAQRKAQEEQAAKDRAELDRLRAEAAARQAAIRAEHDAKIAAEEVKRAEEKAKAQAIRDAEQAELDRQRAEIEAERQKVEADRLAQEQAAREVQSGYQALHDFVDRFGDDKEFQTIARTISKWLDAQKEVAA
ncbi:MAG: DUF1351 domain-containing protein [Acidithiobacillus ferriphilus]